MDFNVKIRAFVVRKLKNEAAMTSLIFAHSRYDFRFVYHRSDDAIKCVVFIRQSNSSTELWLTAIITSEIAENGHHIVEIINTNWRRSLLLMTK